MGVEELREICKLTAELTKTKQGECAHLSVENFAPELFGKLITTYKCAMMDVRKGAGNGMD
jgi:hypothetical protein